jgi:hypothetical protein
MVVPHHAYLKMKLPSPRGVITVAGCYKKSIECTRASSKLGEALVITEEKRQLLQQVAATQPGHPASGARDIPPEVDKEVKALVSGAGPSSRKEGVPDDPQV